MPRTPVGEMKFSKIYPLLVQKVQRKGRTKEELDTVIRWLTGYDMETVDPDVSYQDFFDHAPAMNPRASLITGTVCGIRVETIEDPLMQNVRRLDKLADELAKGRPLEKILR